MKEYVKPQDNPNLDRIILVPKIRENFIPDDDIRKTSVKLAVVTNKLRTYQEGVKSCLWGHLKFPWSREVYKFSMIYNGEKVNSFCPVHETAIVDESNPEESLKQLYFTCVLLERSLRIDMSLDFGLGYITNLAEAGLNQDKHTPIENLLDQYAHALALRTSTRP